MRDASQSGLDRHPAPAAADGFAAMAPGAGQLHLHQTLRARPEAAAEARRLVAGLLAPTGASGEVSAAVLLAVSEAVTNVILHAYCGRAGDVHLTTSLIGHELTIIVDDDGRGIREPAARPGLGYGLKLIADAADSLIISERGTGGTRVQMCFRI